MGVQDRDWYHEAQKERERKAVRFGSGRTALLFPEATDGHL